MTSKLSTVTDNLAGKMRQADEGLSEAVQNFRGMTWHHTEIPGRMELVPFGIHHIVPHNGGRAAGMWAYGPR